MNKTDKKVLEYLGRAWKIIDKIHGEGVSVANTVPIEIAKMIQIEESKDD